MINLFSFANIVLVAGYIKIRVEVSNILLTGASFCYMQYSNTDSLLNVQILRTDIY